MNLNDLAQTLENNADRERLKELQSEDSDAMALDEFEDQVLND